MFDASEFARVLHRYVLMINAGIYPHYLKNSTDKCRYGDREILGFEFFTGDISLADIFLADKGERLNDCRN